MKNKGFLIGGIVLVVVLILVAVFMPTDKEEKKENKKEELLGIDYSKEGHELSMDKYDTTNPVVAMEIKDYGTIVIELYPDIAPNTVNNFISLVRKGFYDNNTFHRLMTGFVLQGGDPTGTGTGGPGYSIKGEFNNNDFTNDLKHEKGVVSMARSNSYDSGGSQFFIMLGTAEHLDGNYAAFGRVIDGMDLVERIEKEETVSDTSSGKLAKNLILVKSVVDLKGKEYPEPEKIK